VLSWDHNRTVLDEVARQVLGQVSAPAMPLDPAVEDRITSSKRAKELEDLPRMGSLDKRRVKIGRGTLAALRDAG